MNLESLKTLVRLILSKLGRIKILVDNGHGWNTAGKCSPDSVVKEWHVNRDIAEAEVTYLKGLGFDAELLVPEEYDVSLAERCRRVNYWCNLLGRDHVLMLSVHLNASGRGDWMPGRGWSVWTTVGVTQSDAWAEAVWQRAHVKWPGSSGGLKCISQTKDGDHDYESNFYVLRHTICPAILCEDFFMDNAQDYAYINSATFHYEIAEVLALGTIDYLKQRAGL